MITNHAWIQYFWIIFKGLSLKETYKKQMKWKTDKQTYMACYEACFNKKLNVNVKL